MAAPRKYPDELRERAIRLVLDAGVGVTTRQLRYGTERSAPPLPAERARDAVL